MYINMYINIYVCTHIYIFARMGLVNDLTQIINTELFEWKIFALSCPTHLFIQSLSCDVPGYWYAYKYEWGISPPYSGELCKNTHDLSSFILYSLLSCVLLVFEDGEGSAWKVTVYIQRDL